MLLEYFLDQILCGHDQSDIDQKRPANIAYGLPHHNSNELLSSPFTSVL